MVKNIFLQFTELYNMTCTCAGALTTEGPGVITPHSNFQTKQGPTVSVSTSGILLLGVQKLYGPEISRFLQGTLQFFGNSLTFFPTTKGN